MPPEIVIVQPFDFVGSVIVPGLAILISAGLAIWIASTERRAAEKSRIQAETAAMIRALSDLNVAAIKPVDQMKLHLASVEFGRQLSVFTAHMPNRAIAVPQYTAVLMARAIATDDTEILRKAAGFIQTGLDEWTRGRVSAAEFAANMPLDLHEVWTDGFDPSAWKATLTVAPPS